VVTVSGHRVLIAVPAGYSFEMKAEENGAQAVSMENPIWGISISATVTPTTEADIQSSEWQQNLIVSFCADALSQSAEKDYKFKALEPKQGTGTYCIFTDARLANKKESIPKGEFAHMTGGVKALKGCIVVFQVMSNDVTSEEYREALGLFKESFNGK